MGREPRMENATAARGRGLRAVRAIAGMAIGGALLWLALRGTSADELAGLARHVQWQWIANAIALYWVALLWRTARWRLLLQGIAPEASIECEQFHRIGEVLLVGYAVNNVLPARLGELFRADYAGRRLGLNRAAVFGTIVIERLADLLVIVVGLGGGLAVLCSIDGALPAGYSAPLAIAAAAAAAAMIAAGGSIWGAMRRPQLIDRLPRFARRAASELLGGLGCLQHSGIGSVLLLTLLIWTLEGVAIWSLVHSAGFALGAAQTAVLLGALNLGTLVPTAPAYLGSYQLIFGWCLAGFGLPAAIGVFGASLMQLLVLGPVSIAGLLLYSTRHVAAALRPAGG